MKKVFVLVILLFNTLFLVAQNKVENLEATYAHYFELPRETIYLHINKSEYVHKEAIWFKGYVYDRKNNLPATNTSNIHLGLYDSEGALVNKKLYLGYEGYVRGHFPIDSTIASGTYYLKASTNWMRNFIEDDSYTAQISITELKKEPSSNDRLIESSETRDGENTSNTADKNVTYDFQLLPESGHAITDHINTIGVKILDQNGMGVKNIRGKVVDHAHNEITTFNINAYGMGKFLLNYEQGKSYKAIASLPNGDLIEEFLPAPDKIGVNLNIINSRKDRVVVTMNKTLKTNEEEFILLFHRDGVMKRFNINFNGESKIDLTLLRENLIKDVNIVTLLDKKGTPLAERLFYNHQNDIQSNDLKVAYNQKTTDSLLLNISQIAQDSIYYNYSVSVLPQNSKAYNHPDNIVSSLKLLPYINETIEAPRYYFVETNRRKKFDLDLLLLTQGWSRYKWTNIFSKPAKPLFKFENGITLAGRLNETFKGKTKDVSLYLFSFKNSPSRLLALNSDQSFNVDNLFPETGEAIKISMVGDPERKKAPGLYTRLTNNIIESKAKVDASALRSIKSENYLTPSFFDLRSFITDDTVLLDAVVVKGKGKERDAAIAGTITRGKLVELGDKSYRFGTLLNLIERNGYRVLKDPKGSVSITTLRNNSIRGELSPLIFIDNAPQTDFDLLTTYPISQIDKIYFDKSGLGYGVRGAAGIINIYTRTDGGYVNPNASSPVYSKKVDVGFEPNKVFYAPRYISYQTFGFKKYGVVQWFSDIVLTGEDNQTLKMPHCEQNSLILYIEGMSNEGHLISKTVTLEIPK